jgi:hypothetical protein
MRPRRLVHPVVEILSALSGSEGHLRPSFELDG